ncbi:phage holin family protein [Agrococcus sp. SGAir0287]|uniref:phage holin family protein n=1 Tax=Agrococcus sp. SGAir0287 TaxID=2070347 RepID=UPI0010CCE8F8|nr:phage holin family protein [Agrococcus sp. SGAir0287]QCR18181.1 hypothetical protein C1N71_00910 [Agrococcus sp. SGAir0287]
MAEREGRRTPIDVVRDLPRQLRAIVREQLDELRRDVMDRTRDARMGVALLAAAGGLALATVTTLAVTVVVALAEVLPWWGAILVVVGPLAIVTGILAALGMRRLSSGGADDAVGRDVRVRDETRR